MILAHELHRWYGPTHAVRGVSLDIGRGEIVGLLGPNGAGKSSTIRMIAGVLSPHRGGITLDGVDASKHPVRARASLGYLPETAAVYTEMPVRSFLMHRAALAGVAPRERRGRVSEAMERCRVLDVAKKRAGALSKGYRQRVALAAAIVHDPPILILDEPTNGLDPSQLRDARSLIGDLARDRTVLVCSHVLGEIERICERVIIIGGGRVLADAGIGALRSAGGRCLVEAHGDACGLTIPGASIDTVTPLDGGWCRIMVRGEGEDLSERVGATLAGIGLRIRELRPVTESLEDVFVRVLDADGAGAATSAQATEGVSP